MDYYSRVNSHQMYATVTQLVKRSPRMQEIRVRSPFTTHRSRETGNESSSANRNGRQQV